MSSRDIQNATFSFKTINSPTGVPALSFAPDGGVVVRNPNSTADNSVATNAYVQQVVASAGNIGMSPQNSYEWTGDYQVFNNGQIVSIGQNLDAPPVQPITGDLSLNDQFGIQFGNNRKGHGESDFLNWSGNLKGGFAWSNISNINSYKTLATLYYDNAQNVTMNLTGISAEYQINGQNILVPNPASKSENNAFQALNSFSKTTTFNGDVTLNGATDVVGNATFNSGTLNLVNSAQPTYQGLIDYSSSGSIILKTNQAQQGVTVSSGTNNTTFYADSSSRLNLGFNGLYTTGNIFSNNYTSTGAINANNMTITGTATAPTAPKNTNTTQLATCEFVLANQTTLTDVAQLGAENTFTKTNTFESPASTTANIQLSCAGQQGQVALSYSVANLSVKMPNIGSQMLLYSDTNVATLQPTSSGMNLNGSPILTTATAGGTVTASGTNNFTGINKFNTSTGALGVTDGTNNASISQSGPSISMATSGGSSGLTLRNGTGTATLYNNTATGLASTGDFSAVNLNSSGALTITAGVQSATPQLTVTNTVNGGTVNLATDLALGNFNPLVQAGDSLMWFANGTTPSAIDTGALTIAGWSNATYGMRFNNVGKTIDMYGTVNANGSPVTTTASLNTKLTGYAQLINANFTQLQVGSENVASQVFTNATYAKIAGGNFTGLVGLNAGATCPTNANNDLISKYPTQNTVNEVTLKGYVAYAVAGALNQYFVGQIVTGMMPQASLGTSFLICDGTQYNTAQYPELFTIIGFNYGGDGNTYFKVPQMQKAFPIGGNSVTGNPAVPYYVDIDDFRDPQYYSGITGGSTYITKAPAHSHGITEPNTGQGHSHGYGEGYAHTGVGTDAYCVKVPDTADNAYNTAFHTTGITINDNISLGRIGVVPPFIAVNYWIYAGLATY